MLQRIQTVFLFLVVASMVAMLFVPYWSIANADKSEIVVFTALHQETRIVGEEAVKVQFPYLYVGILAAAAATIAFITITKFKNRMLQMKLGLLNSLIIIGVLGFVLYFTNTLEIKEGETNGMELGLFLPAIAMVFNSMANRFIRKDEKLVRSVDRIR